MNLKKSFLKHKRSWKVCVQIYPLSTYNYLCIRIIWFSSPVLGLSPTPAIPHNWSFRSTSFLTKENSLLWAVSSATTKALVTSRFMWPSSLGEQSFTWPFSVLTKTSGLHECFKVLDLKCFTFLQRKTKQPTLPNATKLLKIRSLYWIFNNS